MSNLCDNCPRKQPYYPVDSCPDCGAPGLMMSTATHLARCEYCGQEYGIPLIVPGNCDEVVTWGRYTVTIKPPLTLEQLRRLARIVDESSVTLYKEAKAGDLCFEELSYGQVFWLRTILRPLGVEIEVTPKLQEYGRYMECEKIGWNVPVPYDRKIPTKVVWLADSILRLSHSEEEWLELEKEFHDHWDVIGRTAQDYLRECGAGEALAMACSGIRWAREKES